MTPIVLLTKLLVGAYPQWIGSSPSDRQRIYFANHTSHLDTIVLWSSLPKEMRSHTRPVAAKDYWIKGALRRRIAIEELNVVLVDRRRTEHADPLEPLRQCLQEGSSMIIFPEGTRRPPFRVNSRAVFGALRASFPMWNSSPFILKICTKPCPKEL